MSHVNTFRSHLMQQFVAQSSRQMRPPLALTSVVGPRHGGKVCSSSSHTGCVSTTATNGESSTKFQQQKQVNRTDSNGNADEYNGGVQNHVPEEAQLVQSIIISRRTVSNYAPKSSWESYPQKILMIRQAIFRAITCAIQAPNHRRTEPWTFKTLIYPSTKRQALLNLIHDDKRQRWDNVPAFVVALVHGQPNQVEELSLSLPKPSHDELQNAVSPTNYSTINSGISLQHEVPLIPPSTMQQMEDVSIVSNSLLQAVRKWLVVTCEIVFASPI